MHLLTEWEGRTRKYLARGQYVLTEITRLNTSEFYYLDELNGNCTVLYLCSYSVLVHMNVVPRSTMHMNTNGGTEN